MIYVSFKDKEIYQRMKYSCIHRLMYKTNTHIAVELEFIDKDSSWHTMLPFEDDLKEIDEKVKTKTASEEEIDLIKRFSFYRKWQKRKLYTIEEFNELFEPIQEPSIYKII